METGVVGKMTTSGTSNTHSGRAFEKEALRYLRHKFPSIQPRVAVNIGVNGKKAHVFDLGDPEEQVVVECKRHTWTAGGNVPSAKLSVWNEAMYLFHATPAKYRRILFILRDYSRKRGITLAEYYIRTYVHLIPRGVEIWEYDTSKRSARQVYPTDRKADAL